MPTGLLRRLSRRYKVPTVTIDIKSLFNAVTVDSNSGRPAIIMVHINLQSLSVHAEEVSTDRFSWALMIMVITKSWEDATGPVNIKSNN